MAALFHSQHVHIALTRIPTTCFCIGQDSDSEPITISESSNVIKPLWLHHTVLELCLDRYRSHAKVEVRCSLSCIVNIMQEIFVPVPLCK